MHHRTWFPYILVGLTLLLGLGVLVWLNPRLQDAPAYSFEEIDPVTTEDYRSTLTTLIQESGDDANAMYQILLDLTVPAGYQALHLQLVQAYYKLSINDIEAGQAGLDAARSDYPWLAEALQ